MSDYYKIVIWMFIPFLIVSCLFSFLFYESNMYRNFWLSEIDQSTALKYHIIERGLYNENPYLRKDFSDHEMLYKL